MLGWGAGWSDSPLWGFEQQVFAVFLIVELGIGFVAGWIVRGRK